MRCGRDATTGINNQQCYLISWWISDGETPVSKTPCTWKKKIIFFFEKDRRAAAAKTRMCFASETGVTPRLPVGGSAGAKLKHALITSIPDREDDVYERKGTRPTIGCLLDNLCIFPLIFSIPSRRASPVEPHKPGPPAYSNKAIFTTQEPRRDELEIITRGSRQYFIS